MYVFLSNLSYLQDFEEPIGWGDIEVNIWEDGGGGKEKGMGPFS